MTVVNPVENIKGIDGFPINYYHITDAFLMQKVNSFRFTSCAKTKSEVAFTTAKWFKQKGTGRARQGARSNPHMKGGGKAHGPRPRYSPIKLNRRVKRSAWLSALAWHLERGTIFGVDDAQTEKMLKTREVAAMLDNAGLYDRTLICCGASSPLQRSARNIRNIAVLTPDRLNVRDVMLADCLLCTTAALTEIELRASAIRSETGLKRGALNLAAADLIQASGVAGKGDLSIGGDLSQEAPDE